MPLHSYISYKEIEQLGPNHLKRRFAINYLVAKDDIQNLEAGVVKNIRLTDKGEKSFYSEHYKEIGDKQIADFWRNALTLLLSIVVTVAAVIALDDNYKEEIKSIPKIQNNLKKIEQQLDSIKNLMLPLHIVFDSSLNK